MIVAELRRRPRAGTRAALAAAKLTLARRARDHRRAARARRGRGALPGARPPTPTQIADFLDHLRAAAGAPRHDDAARRRGSAARRRAARSSTLAPSEVFTLAGAGRIDTADGTVRGHAACGGDPARTAAARAGGRRGPRRARAARARRDLPHLAARAGAEHLSTRARAPTTRCRRRPRPTSRRSCRSCFVVTGHARGQTQTANQRCSKASRAPNATSTPPVTPSRIRRGRGRRRKSPIRATTNV